MTDLKELNIPKDVADIFAQIRQGIDEINNKPVAALETGHDTRGRK